MTGRYISVSAVVKKISSDGCKYSMNHIVLLFEPLFDELIRRQYIICDNEDGRYIFVGNSLEVRRGGASSTRLWEIADPTGQIVRRASSSAAAADHHTSGSIDHSSEQTAQALTSSETIEPARVICHRGVPDDQRTVANQSLSHPDSGTDAK
jgi:hypothetical protein